MFNRCNNEVHPLLANYVKDIQIISESSQLTTPYKVYPGVFIVMGFQYQGRLNVMAADGKPRLLKCCGMTGLLKAYRTFQTTTATTVTILFRFYPWAIPALLNIPANIVTNQSLGLEDILKEKIINNLQERIQTAQNPYVAAEIIQKILIQLHSMQNKKIVSQPRIITITKELANDPIMNSIEKLADQYGYSKRSLERHFQETVGLSPKRFMLTARFQRVLRMLQANVHWEAIAEPLGYYDQAHFIKDFKQFTGITPHQFAQATS